MSQIFFDCGCERTWPRGFAEARKHDDAQNAQRYFGIFLKNTAASGIAICRTSCRLQWFCYGSHSVSFNQIFPAKKRETNEHR